jgi:hypothetical protein
VSSEWCPRCQAYQSTVVTTSHRQATDEQGNTVQITTYSYHCGTCSMFLRSEHIEGPPEDDLDESGQERELADRD